jgi:hypothetical protein
VDGGIGVHGIGVHGIGVHGIGVHTPTAEIKKLKKKENVAQLIVAPITFFLIVFFF